MCGLWPLQIIGNPNRGAGLLARKGEHLRAVHNNATYALRKCAVRRVHGYEGRLGCRLGSRGFDAWHRFDDLVDQSVRASFFGIHEAIAIGIFLYLL